MHEATITVRKVWPAFKPGDKRTSVDDTEGGKWRVEVETAAGMTEGEEYTIGYTKESFNNKAYNLIKNIKPASEQRPATNGHALNGSGPEKGMIIKESVALLAAGKTPNQILGYFRAAEEIYSQLKSPTALNDAVSDIGETF